MADTALSPADFELMRGAHVEKYGACHACPESTDAYGHLEYQPWPCDAARLLAEIDRRNSAIRAWTAERVAGISYGLLGPSTNDELTPRKAVP